MTDGNNGALPDGDEGVAVVRSFVDRTHHAILARGSFGGLHEAYVRHAADIDELPDETTRAMMLRAMTGSVLHLSLLPPDQFCSWTFNMIDPSLNLFLAGDNNGHQITGRAFFDNVKTGDGNRMFFETQRPRHKSAQSVVDFEGEDLNEAFSRFYGKALQMQARLFEPAPGEAILIQGLPMVDRQWLWALDVEGATRAVDEAEEIEARTYRFRCGCDVQKVTVAIRGIFEANPEELFAGDDHVDVQCPRCGRTWTISRSDFARPQDET